jgi:hypothetical protein
MSNRLVPMKDMSFEDAPRFERCAATRTFVSITTCGVGIMVRSQALFEDQSGSSRWFGGANDYELESHTIA